MELDCKFFSVKILWHGTQGSIRSQVMRAYSKHDKVSAIKKHRELTGAGLKDSVDYVNSLFPADPTP